MNRWCDTCINLERSNVENIENDLVRCKKADLDVIEYAQGKKDGWCESWDGKLPENYEAFYREYEALCKKHGLMVISEGEEVTIYRYREGLWGLRNSTADDDVGLE